MCLIVNYKASEEFRRSGLKTITIYKVLRHAPKSKLFALSPYQCSRYYWGRTKQIPKATYEYVMAGIRRNRECDLESAIHVGAIHAYLKKENAVDEMGRFSYALVAKVEVPAEDVIALGYQNQIVLKRLKINKSNIIHGKKKL